MQYLNSKVSLQKFSCVSQIFLEILQALDVQFSLVKSICLLKL